MLLYLTIAARCLLAAVFAGSFGGKAAGHQRFAAFQASLRDLRLVPAHLHRAVAMLVVAAEGMTCVALALPNRAAGAGGLAAAAMLLTTFTVAVAVAMARGARAACGCFGPSRVPLGAQHLLRNAALIAVALAGLAATGPADGPPDVSAAVIAALAGLLVGGLVVVLDDILDLFRPLHIKP